MANDNENAPASTLGAEGMSARVAEIIHKRQSAAEMHAWAGHVQGLSADEAHAKADLRQTEADRLAAIDPAQVMIEAGGEVVPDPPDKKTFYDTLRTRPSSVAVDASRHRTALTKTVGVAAMALDVAETVQAANSLEKMLAHQSAATHKAGMDLIALGTSLAERFANHGYQNAILTTEAARLINAGARMFDCTQRGALALHRLRNSGQQTMVVQHVHVGDGGQAVVAGQMKGRGRSRRSA